MSSGVESRADVSALRAMAHPVRLQILSLLTGTAMSAAEVARELGITHANASYHLRQLADAGHLVPAGEESVRGGRAKRYRYDLDRQPETAPDSDTAAVYYQAIAAELVRRAGHRRDVGARGTSSDAELWVPPQVWQQVLDQVLAAVDDVHRAALPPRTPGAVHVSVTTALFEMDRPGGKR
jgi:DNA-binding transcriptional ArsR family regulator